MYAAGVDSVIVEFRCVSSSVSPTSKWVLGGKIRSSAHDVLALAASPLVKVDMVRMFNAKLSKDDASGIRKRGLLVSGGVDSRVRLHLIGYSLDPPPLLHCPHCSWYFSPGGLHHRAASLSPFPSRSPVSVAYSRCQDDTPLRRRARFLTHCGTSLDLWQTGDSADSKAEPEPEVGDEDEHPGGGRIQDGDRMRLSSSYLHMMHIETQTQSGRGFNLIASALSPDGTWAAASDNHTVKLYRLVSSDTINPHLVQCARVERASSILGSSPSNCLCFSAVSNLLCGLLIMRVSMFLYFVLKDSTLLLMGVLGGKIKVLLLLAIRFLLP